MNIRISEIEYELPQKVVSNDELDKLFPNWNIHSLSEKTGVYSRHIAEEDETALDLACRACDKLATKLNLTEDIDGIIFCTQSADYVMPSNAFLIHKHLNLNHSVLAFDYNLACSGYIYGLVIARGLISTSVAKNILLVNSDTYSKFINKKDRSTVALFGDGASVSLISKFEGEGIIDVILSSSGTDFDYFYIPAGGCRNPKSQYNMIENTDHNGNIRSAENIHMNGFAVWKFISSTVPNQINEILNRNNLKMKDIDLFIFHQASKMTLDSLINRLNINSKKVFINLHDKGNLVSASIPIALKEATDIGVLKRGNLIVLSGFGVGLSWGTILLRY